MRHATGGFVIARVLVTDDTDKQAIAQRQRILNARFGSNMTQIVHAIAIDIATSSCSGKFKYDERSQRRQCNRTRGSGMNPYDKVAAKLIMTTAQGWSSRYFVESQVTPSARSRRTRRK
jgi:hypothetical protein